MTEQKKPEPGQWWFSNDDRSVAYIVGVTSDGVVAYQTDPGTEIYADHAEWHDWHHEPDCDSWTWEKPDWVTQDRVPARPGIDQRRWVRPDGTVDPGDDWGDCELTVANHGIKAVHGFQSCGSRLELRCLRKDLPECPRVAEAVDVSTKALHELAAMVGVDPAGMSSQEIADAVIAKNREAAKAVESAKTCVMCNGPADITDDSCRQCHEFAIEQVCGVKPDLKIYMTVDGALYCYTKPRTPLHKQIQFCSCGCFVVEVGNG